jgi:hypothetical protein
MVPHASTRPPPVTRHAAMTVVVVLEVLVEVDVLELLLLVDVLELLLLVLVELLELLVLVDVLVVVVVEHVLRQRAPAGLLVVSPSAAAGSQNSSSFLMPSPQYVQSLRQVPERIGPFPVRMAVPSHCSTGSVAVS